MRKPVAVKKQCSHCGLLLPLDNFHDAPRRRSIGKFAHCERCHTAETHRRRAEGYTIVERARAKERRRSDPGFVAACRKRQIVCDLKKLGATYRDYEQLVKTQGNSCAICGTHAAQNLHGRLYIDHDHATKKLRGLLCQKCNSGLGYFRDNPALFIRAMEYMRCGAQ